MQKITNIIAKLLSKDYINIFLYTGTLFIILAVIGYVAFIYKKNEQKQPPIAHPSGTIIKKKLNGGLEAEVISASRNAKDLSITISLYNAGKDIAYLMLIGPTSAVDNSGVSYSYQGASGISICPWHGNTTGQCVNAFPNEPSEFLSYLTRIDPETTLSMIVQLHAFSRAPYGSTVDFSTVLAARFVSDPLQDEAAHDDLKVRGIQLMNLGFLGEAVIEFR